MLSILLTGKNKSDGHRQELELYIWHLSTFIPHAPVALQMYPLHRSRLNAHKHTLWCDLSTSCVSPARTAPPDYLIGLSLHGGSR